MNKRMIIFLLSLTLSYTTLTSGIITGEIITGRASYDNIGISVFIAGIPTPILYYPHNKTYLITNITLNYSYSGLPDNITYSIDGGTNNTASGNTTTQVLFTEGLRRLDLWANNAYGSGNNRTYLTINTTKLILQYQQFNGSTKGLSTDFRTIAYEDLLNLSGVIFENTTHGKITFQETINIENDSDTTDRTVDFDSYITISNNSISINSSQLPNLNKSARLHFYNLTYTNPQVLINGVTCPESICSNQTYNSGTLTINVAHFSTFTIQETPEEEPEPEPSSGGGGGTAGPQTYYELEIITPGKISLGKTDEVIIPIIIKNLEKTLTMNDIILSATTTQKELSLVLEETTISELQPGENKTLMLFLKSTNLAVGNYELRLTAKIIQPAFTEDKSVYVSITELIGTVEITERIVIAQELFNHNPECLELSPLLTQAQEESEAGRIVRARTLIQEAISRCRDLVTNKEFPQEEKKDLRFHIILVLTLIGILALFFIVRRKPEKQTRKRKTRF